MVIGIKAGRELWAYAETCRRRLREDHNLEYQHSTDPDALVRKVALITGEPTNFTTTYHPDFSALVGGEFRWSSLTDAARKTVGVSVHRLFETDDFIEDIALGRLFSDAPDLDMGLPELVSDTDRKVLENMSATVPRLSGRIVFGGSMWLSERLREKGIMALYSQLGQAISLLQFQFDTFAIFRKMDDRYSFNPSGRLGFRHAVHLLTGIYPPHGYPLDVALQWKGRQDLLKEVRQLAT